MSLGNKWFVTFSHLFPPYSDDETFLSADDLRVNLWNLSINDQSFNIVDMKPSNMEELTEVRI
jgi:serine/threonine-protein phosphatase 2A regulatory subunit B